MITPIQALEAVIAETTARSYEIARNLGLRDIELQLLSYARFVAEAEAMAAAARTAHERELLRQAEREVEISLQAYAARLFADPKTGELRSAANADERKLAIAQLSSQDRILKGRARRAEKAAAERLSAEATAAGATALYQAWREVLRMRTAEANRAAARGE